MSYETVKAIIKNFSVEEQRRIITEFVEDESNPYEQRLEIYLSTPQALQARPHNHLWSHPEFDDDEWYSYDGSWERHQEIDLREIPEAQEWDEAKTRKWHEGCMKEGMWAFTFDW